MEQHRNAMKAAIIYAQQGKYEQAIEQAKKAVSLNPRNISYLFNLAELLATDGQLEAALAYYEKALKVNPKFSPAIVGKCNCLTESGKPLEALQLLEKANTSDHQIQLQLAKTYFALSDMDRAEAAVKTILENSASDYEARLLLAQINFERRNLPAAVVLADELIKSDPSKSGAYILLSQCLVLTHSGLFNAVELVKSAEQSAVQKAYVFSQLGQAFDRLALTTTRSEPDFVEKKYAWRVLAQECWRQAVLASPADAELRYNYALSLRKNRQFVDAYYQVTKSLELEPNNKKALLLQDKLKQAKYDLFGWIKFYTDGKNK